MKKNILIIKWGAIGDVIMTLPMIYFLKKKMPHASVSWVLGNIVKDLVGATKLADQIISFDEEKLFNEGLLSKIFSLIKIWKKIGFRKYDQIYILHKDCRYLAISLFSFGKKIRLKMEKTFFPKIYHAKQYLNLIDPDANIIYPKLKICLKTNLSKILPQKSFIILAPGGAKNPLSSTALKRWPISNYVELAKQLVDESFSVVIIGNETDTWITPYFNKVSILNLIGQTSLLDILALYEKASLLVTHDTGALHLAKLTSIKTIGLYGPTNPQEYAPENMQIQILWGGKNLSCRPCYDGKNFPQCSNNQCLKQINVRSVLNKIRTTTYDTE